MATRDLSKMSAQELLALAKQQVAGVQKTKDELVAEGKLTPEVAAEASAKLAGGTAKLTPFVEPKRLPAIQDIAARAKATAAATAGKTLPTPTAGPTDRVSGTVNLSAALNKAVEVARKQRQSAELDFVGGRIPPGAISASTFGGLMAGLNRASTQFTEPLVSEAVKAASEEQANIEKEKSDIRDLALTLTENGADQATVQGILNAPDINSAIAMSAGALQNITDEDIDIRQVGSNLVKVNKEGEVEVLYSGASTGGGGAGSTSFSAVELKKLEQAGLSQAPRQKQLDYLYGDDSKDTSVGDLSIELEQSRGDDGFSNSQLYIDAYNAWIQAGKLPQDFFSKFDPDFYLNPNDASIPSQIKGEMTNQTVANPWG